MTVWFLLVASMWCSLISRLNYPRAVTDELPLDPDWRRRVSSMSEVRNGGAKSIGLLWNVYLFFQLVLWTRTTGVTLVSSCSITLTWTFPWPRATELPNSSAKGSSTRHWRRPRVCLAPNAGLEALVPRERIEWLKRLRKVPQSH